ncbi:hypothetical protein RFI_12135, partial [Reticulomyxa filosa]
ILESEESLEVDTNQNVRNEVARANANTNTNANGRNLTIDTTNTAAATTTTTTTATAIQNENAQKNNESNKILTQATDNNVLQSPSLSPQSQAVMIEDEFPFEVDMSVGEKEKPSEMEESHSFHITNHNNSIKADQTDYFDLYAEKEKEKELSWSRSNSEWLMVPLPPNSA